MNSFTNTLFTASAKNLKKRPSLLLRKHLSVAKDISSDLLPRKKYLLGWDTHR